MMKTIRKHLISVLLIVVVLVSLSACGSSGTAESSAAPVDVSSGADTAPVDLDLTVLSSTMVYSEVYNIMMSPDEYIGKTIRMDGQCLSAYYEPTDMTYYSIVIQDATVCCAQGIEYVLSDGQSYPADDTEATVVGRFESYDEEGTTWYHLVDAVVET